ncbi:MAG: hypothetical protein ACOYXT_28915 [Bacteroidota bacterium]
MDNFLNKNSGQEITRMNRLLRLLFLSINLFVLLPVTGIAFTENFIPSRFRYLHTMLVALAAIVVSQRKEILTKTF